MPGNGFTQVSETEEKWEITFLCNLGELPRHAHEKILGMSNAQHSD